MGRGTSVWCARGTWESYVLLPCFSPFPLPPFLTDSFPSHSQGKVFSASWCPDDPTTLAVAGSKANLQIWDTATNAGIRSTFGDRLKALGKDLNKGGQGVIGLAADEEDDEFEDEVCSSFFSLSPSHRVRTDCFALLAGLSDVFGRRVRGVFVVAFSLS